MKIKAVLIGGEDHYLGLYLVDLFKGLDDIVVMGCNEALPEPDIFTITCDMLEQQELREMSKLIAMGAPQFQYKPTLPYRGKAKAKHRNSNRWG